jgi:hypothetical protein
MYKQRIDIVERKERLTFRSSAPAPRSASVSSRFSGWRGALIVGVRPKIRTKLFPNPEAHKRQPTQDFDMYIIQSIPSWVYPALVPLIGLLAGLYQHFKKRKVDACDKLHAAFAPSLAIIRLGFVERGQFNQKSKEWGVAVSEKKKP